MEAKLEMTLEEAVAIVNLLGSLPTLEWPAQGLRSACLLMCWRKLQHHHSPHHVVQVSPSHSP